MSVRGRSKSLRTRPHICDKWDPDSIAFSQLSHTGAAARRCLMVLGRQWAYTQCYREEVGGEPHISHNLPSYLPRFHTGTDFILLDDSSTPKVITQQCPTGNGISRTLDCKCDATPLRHCHHHTTQSISGRCTEKVGFKRGVEQRMSSG